jgi:hypothetical protein
LPLRLPVQAVYKFDDRRIVAGRIQSGRIAVGDEIAVAPSGKRAVVRSIEAWPGNGAAEPREAGAGQSVGITLDRELFIARGDVIARVEHPAPAGRRLRARIFWLHDSPLATRAYVTVRIGTAETRGTITAIANTLDPGDQSAAKRDTIAQNHVGEVEITLSNPIAADLYEVNPRTGRIVLDFGGHIAGGGLVLALDGESKAVSASVEKSQALVPRATDLDRVLARLNLSQRLARIRGELDGPIVFTTSFGLEDQVILHHICEAGLDIDSSRSTPAGCFRKPIRLGKRPSSATAAASGRYIRSRRRLKSSSRPKVSTASIMPRKRASLVATCETSSH